MERKRPTNNCCKQSCKQITVNAVSVAFVKCARKEKLIKKKCALQPRFRFFPQFRTQLLSATAPSRNAWRKKCNFFFHQERKLIYKNCQRREKDHVPNPNEKLSQEFRTNKSLNRRQLKFFFTFLVFSSFYQKNDNGFSEIWLKDIYTNLPINCRSI